MSRVTPINKRAIRTTSRRSEKGEHHVNWSLWGDIFCLFFWGTCVHVISAAAAAKMRALFVEGIAPSLLTLYSGDGTIFTQCGVNITLRTNRVRVSSAKTAQGGGSPRFPLATCISAVPPPPYRRRQTRPTAQTHGARLVLCSGSMSDPPVCGRQVDGLPCTRIGGREVAR
jgi:hypothetical protein